MGSKNIFLNAEFVKSALLVKDLPADYGSEVAFCGRSNCGKSSVLNALTGNRRLAKTSKTPGRTQAMNVFCLESSCKKRIVDLPGYGFAKTSKGKRKEWAKVIGQYLNTRNSLRGIVVIMDIRHSFKESDIVLINWSKETQIPLKILLNKSDKLSKTQLLNKVKKCNHICKELDVEDVQVFSAKKLSGLKELKKSLSDWFRL